MTDPRAEAERLVAGMIDQMTRRGMVSQPDLIKTIAAIWESIKLIDVSAGIDQAALTARGIPTVEKLRLLYPARAKS